MFSLPQIRKKLRAFADPSKRRILSSFFKCGPGEYGEGDQFLGITVPQIRALIPLSRNLSFADLKKLILSPAHEERLLGLLILADRFSKAKPEDRGKVYSFYLKNREGVNNWDLVDSSAHKIAGAYLENKSHRPLFRLACSKNMWDRRIAIISTWHFIRQGNLQTTFKMSRMLLNDQEDLMHKACGWMLREAGKKDRKQLEAFLKNYAHKMPRTMLRYAIEKFSADERERYLLIKKPPEKKQMQGAHKRTRRRI